MPNLKIYLAEPLWDSHGPALLAALPALRDRLMQDLGVPRAACQLAVVPVHGLPDQPQCNVEIALLRHPDRTPDRIGALCEALRAQLAPILGTPPALRATALDPAHYVTLK